MENYNETIEKILSLISHNNGINYDMLVDDEIKHKLSKRLSNSVKLFFDENPFLLTDANIELICDKYENYAFNAFNTYANYQILYDTLLYCDGLFELKNLKDTIEILNEMIKNPPEPNEKLKKAHERYKNYLNGK